MASSTTMTPEVTWAQRSSATEAEKNYVYLTISVPDVDPKKIELDIKPTHLTFTGYSESKKSNYHVQLDFFAEIDPAESKVHHSARDVEFQLRKKELKAEFWPRLLKDKAKVHFLKTNFDKWVDEDEQDAVPEDDDYMSRMGAGGAGALGGAGMGGDGGFGGIDFSKLGGMGGAGGMDFSQLGGMGGGEDDDEEDDEEEGEEEESAAAGAKADSTPAASKKIEEVE